VTAQSHHFYTDLNLLCFGHEPKVLKSANFAECGGEGARCTPTDDQRYTLIINSQNDTAFDILHSVFTNIK